MDKIEKLQSVIDEIKIESRKIEYSSALERLTRRVTELEEKVRKLETKTYIPNK